MPRVLCISDTHNQHPEPAGLPEADVLVFAGDATLRGKAQEWARFWAWVEEVHAQVPHVVVVEGNHDVFPVPAPDGVHVLCGGPVREVAGLRVWGWPGSAWRSEGERVGREAREIDRGQWAHWQSDRAQAEALRALPEGLDILVTHTPPAGIGDRCAGGRVGCPALSLRLGELAQPPRLHIFGHIHEGRGVYQSARTISVNAAHLDGRYRPWGLPPTVVNL